MKDNAISLRLIVMNFLQYAIWGAYLTSMGSYLGKIGLGENIGFFYSMQGIVSLFMPAIIGIIADRFIPAQIALSLSHLFSGTAMLGASYYAATAANVDFGTLFSLYSLSVAFYMPTIALSNSVAYSVLGKAGKDTVKAFPPIRVFGTVGFICTMLFVNFVKSDGVQFQQSHYQFLTSGVLSIVLALYSITLPNCPINKVGGKQSFMEASGLKAFTLFKDKQMAIFFIFSMMLGMLLQITNGYANPFITSFQNSADPAISSSWGAANANALISLSQISETLCILLIPFFLKNFGIKKVMLISMFAWVLRFGLFGAGNPGPGVWMFVLSMIVYGMAFDFFNISGSLYVNQKAPAEMRSSAQGLFMLMTNGFGAAIGMIAAQKIVDYFVGEMNNWSGAWYTFAGFALVVAILFMILFKDPKRQTQEQ